VFRVDVVLEYPLENKVSHFKISFLTDVPCKRVIGLKRMHRLCLFSLCIARADNTPRRHILGAPQRRNPVPERDMTAASTAILRLMLHMSMYIGATNNPRVCRYFSTYS
jgi:hypothetical protein